MTVAEVIVYLIFAYLALGFLFAVWFVTVGISKLDDAAKGTGIGFRLFIFWGSLLLWPVIAKRCIRGEKRPVERNAHRRAAK